MTLFHTYLICGLIVCLMQDALTIEYRDFAWTEEYNKGVTLECKKKYLLSDIEVVAGRTEVEVIEMSLKNVIVYGKTPSLIAKVQQCYWNQLCSFAFPKDKMVTCVTINSTEGNGAIVQEDESFSSGCFLEEIEFLRPVHAKCIKAKLVKNFCERKKGRVVCRKKFPKNKGMIKSHDIFPWYYNYGHLTHKYKFSLPRKKSQLVIGIKSLHVCEDDRLIVRTKNDEVNISDVEENTHLVFTKKKHKFVELEFTVAADSMGCGGFLICYKVMKNGGGDYDGKRRHVCDDLYDRNKVPTVKN